MYDWWLQINPAWSQVVPARFKLFLDDSSCLYTFQISSEYFNCIFADSNCSCMSQIIPGRVKLLLAVLNLFLDVSSCFWMFQTIFGRSHRHMGVQKTSSSLSGSQNKIVFFVMTFKMMRLYALGLSSKFKGRISFRLSQSTREQIDTQQIFE